MSRAAHAHAARFYGAVAASVLAVTAVVVLRSRPPSARPAVAASEPRDAGLVEWCAPGLEPIAGGGCFALGGEVSAPRTLLVYLHGRYAPENEADERERQARVARLATARGYSVLALRGTQGECSDPQLTTWWCWPSNERNAADGTIFVARWASALAEAQRRAPAARRVLLGFSNGGYFAALIASRALAPFDAVAVAHAGPVAPMTPLRTKPPILLIDADDDPSSAEILRLDADLTREAWPHAMIVREGGHALAEWDVEMTLTFFDRVRTEALPLSPPLAPPRAPHPHDASAPEAPAAPTEPPAPSDPPPAPAAPVLNDPP